MAPEIAEPFSLHWYVQPGLVATVSPTLPPWQKVVGPPAFIVGADGIVLGADNPLAVGPVHPFTVCVTVYVAELVTVMDVVVALLLHNNDPVKLLAVNTELPQLLTTVTVGADGIFFGTDPPLPAALTQPFTV